MIIALSLIFINVLGFAFAYFFRERNFSQSLYNSIICLTAAMMFSIVVFDFLPHVFSDFTSLDHPHEGHEHCEHDHGHSHNHGFEWSELNYVKVLIFGLLLVAGNFLQIYAEKGIQKKLQHKFENATLIFAMFLHSFSESAVLYDAYNQLNKSLFVGIILHTLPLSFVLAYTILSRSSSKMSALWFGVYLLSIPIGLISNQLMSDIPNVFQWISILVSGMVLHVIWHIWETVKDKSTKNYLFLSLGVVLGYIITCFHLD